MPKNWNANNPSIRRILADVRELAVQPSDQYAAKPLEDNMFDWHFVIRGPKGSEFEGGVYHGRIVLPSQYPFKPPSIMLLTPNGRWEVKQKICLSISNYHPEHWQPAWGIRTILEALISFMTTPSEGAIGGIDYSKEARKQLALESQKYTHELMPELPKLREEEETEEEKKMKATFASQIAQLHVHNLSGPDNSDSKTQNTSGEETKVNSVEETKTTSVEETKTTSVEETKESAEGSAVEEQENTQEPTSETPANVEPNTGVSSSGNTQIQQENDWVDTLLSYTAFAIVFAIISILYRKALAMQVTSI